MKKILKVLLFLLLGLLLVAFLGGCYIYFFLPDVGKPTDLKVEVTPQRVERGKYIATSVAVCIDCHSTRDWSKFSGPMIAGTDGKGGDRFGKELGFPGTFYARNITPASLGNWTDGELFRAITAGVSKDGSPLFPLMPYAHYGTIDKEDVYSIIAYIRTLKPITNDVPAAKADFPVNIMMHLAPAKPVFTTKPAESDSVKYGGYLVNMGACLDCHSKVDKGAVIPGTEFGGGREFNMPAGTLRTPNITFHSTGIAAMTRSQFINRFKQYKDSSYQSPVIKPTDYNSIMPWTMYAGMTESDISAIYAYLKSVKPIDNTVEKFTPAKSGK